MASVEKYQWKDGTKRYRVWYRDTANKLHQKAGFKRKRDADDFVARLSVSVNDGTYVDPRKSRQLIGDLGRKWMDLKAVGWKESYQRTIKISWRVYVEPKWGNREIGSVTHDEVQQWVNGLSTGDDSWDGKPKSLSVVKRAYGILKDICEMAVDDKIIVQTPTRKIDMPLAGVKRKAVVLTPEQLLNLVEHCGDRGPFILTLGLTGLRWGEAAALTVSDLDFKKHRVNVDKSATWVGSEVALGTPKHGKSRKVPMPSAVEEALRPLVKGKRPGDLVFVDRRGEYMRPQSTAKNNRSWFAKALRDAGLPMMRAHDLRHTAVSIAVSSGADVKVVQRMVGHSYATTTLDTYSDVFDSDLDDVSGNVDKVMNEALHRTKK
ncbi:site-specific integrase [Bifidobacterium sp. ESL0728]|uniref:tyrosine-type recombinase/integrase n=1 Tax=Bifidobacterium sp. ESL0728 TaxID=2983220 RepID=UPI0023F84426|nr:site-specific integrase [Bifidobacterium sp. ESL0728]WEV58960.1 site-specific integrase [Bifidobacterium sp. ESL0728]